MFLLHKKTYKKDDGGCQSEGHSVVSNSLQPHDCSLPGSSVHGILQARILEWVAVPSSKGSSQPRIEPKSPALQMDFSPFEPPGKHPPPPKKPIEIPILHWKTHFVNPKPTQSHCKLIFLRGDVQKRGSLNPGPKGRAKRIHPMSAFWINVSNHCYKKSYKEKQIRRRLWRPTWGLLLINFMM